MIENQTQYLITEMQVKNFEKALTQLDTAIGVHPLLLQAQRDGLQSVLDGLREEMRDYKLKASGKLTIDLVYLSIHLIRHIRDARNVCFSGIALLTGDFQETLNKIEAVTADIGDALNLCLHSPMPDPNPLIPNKYEILLALDDALDLAIDFQNLLITDTVGVADYSKYAAPIEKLEFVFNY